MGIIKDLIFKYYTLPCLKRRILKVKNIMVRYCKSQSEFDGITYCGMTYKVNTEYWVVCYTSLLVDNLKILYDDFSCSFGYSQSWKFKYQGEEIISELSLNNVVLLQKINDKLDRIEHDATCGINERVKQELIDRTNNIKNEREVIKDVFDKENEKR